MAQDGDPLNETRSIIDRDIVRLEGSIRALEESIRALKSRRNELSPISRLPTEILCIIFSLSIPWRPVCPESWTNFSQVSQRWRLLALSAPELWTNIPLSYSGWAQEMLIRSKMAKLTIRSHLYEPRAIETIRSCLYEMNRVEAIDITSGIRGLTLEEIFRDIPKPAPQLRTLCIGCFSGSTFLIHEDFLYDTDRLQRVELFNCRISWASRLLTGLTRLTLEVEPEDAYRTNSSINQFLHALQRMPALTDLHLKDTIPDDSEGSSAYPVVDLPCLRLLSISSGVGSLTAVLRHITFPHSAILNLTCKEKQSTQIHFSNFLSVLATKFLSSLVFRSLSLRGFEVFDETETHGLEFSLWTTATIPDCLPFSETSQSQLQLVLTWPPSPQYRHVEALTFLFDAISLPFLTKLQISTFDYIDSLQTLVEIFGKLPLLELVCVQSCAIQWFLEALVYKTEAAEKSKTAYRNVTFPRLRSISLLETDFVDASVDWLLDCLMERCERNAEVQVLRLDDCYDISPNEVERLKEIVVDVYWDVEASDEEVSTHRDSDEDRDYDDMMEIPLT